jgi:multimeric flavodoxin WrbA
MLTVLGIVGSPRKNGITSRLIDSALEGAKSRGAETRKIYLIDYDVKQFRGTGGAAEGSKYCPEELSRLCEEATGIVLGAPVYWGDINGLTKDFMDSVRIANSRGKPALGTAIAGGSGKGLLSGVQSIYHFLFHKQMKAIDPIPVSRFNLEESLSALRRAGAELAILSKQDSAGKMGDEYWADVSAEYASLRYLRCDHVDEFVMLAESLIRTRKAHDTGQAQIQLDQAKKLIGEGKRSEAARYAVKSYQTLYYPP